MGTASEVLYHNGLEALHAEKVFEETVTVNDTALRTVTIAVDTLTDFLANQQVDTHQTALIFLTSSFAISRILIASFAFVDLLSTSAAYSLSLGFIPFPFFSDDIPSPSRYLSHITYLCYPSVGDPLHFGTLR